MIAKFKTKINIDGAICLSASQKSAVLLILSVDRILISIINNVNAIANIPSQKALIVNWGLFLLYFIIV
jgi:hypothetical protein